MKKLKIISIIAMSIGLIGIISCNCDVKEIATYEHNSGLWGSVEFGIEQKTIDSCEYIIIFGDQGRDIIHKANCNNIYHKN